MIDHSSATTANRRKLNTHHWPAYSPSYLSAVLGSTLSFSSPATPECRPFLLEYSLWLVPGCGVDSLLTLVSTLPRSISQVRMLLISLSPSMTCLRCYWLYRLVSLALSRFCYRLWAFLRDSIDLRALSTDCRTYSWVSFFCNWSSLRCTTSASQYFCPLTSLSSWFSIYRYRLEYFIFSTPTPCVACSSLLRASPISSACCASLSSPISSNSLIVAANLSRHSSWNCLIVWALQAATSFLILFRCSCFEFLTLLFSCSSISLRKRWARWASSICRPAWYSFSFFFMSSRKSPKLRLSMLLSSLVRVLLNLQVCLGVRRLGVLAWLGVDIINYNRGKAYFIIRGRRKGRVY